MFSVNCTIGTTVAHDLHGQHYGRLDITTLAQELQEGCPWMHESYPRNARSPMRCMDAIHNGPFRFQQLLSFSEKYIWIILKSHFYVRGLKEKTFYLEYHLPLYDYKIPLNLNSSIIRHILWSSNLVIYSWQEKFILCFNECFKSLKRTYIIIIALLLVKGHHTTLGVGITESSA